MTPGIASRRAELPLLPPHLLLPGAVSHFGSAVSARRVFLVYSVKSISPSLSELPIRSPASFCLLQSERKKWVKNEVSAVCLLCHPLILPLPLPSHFSFCRVASSPNLFFLTSNLSLSNYLSSMTDQQRLALQENAEIHLTKSLYVQ